MHTGRGNGRRRARGPLVVGTGYQQGVRDSFLGGRKSRTETRCPAGRSSGGATGLAQNSVNHQGFTLWFTGLSGAGKSTISAMIEQRLRDAGAKVEMLDGDVVRENLSKGLGFSKEERDINIRRIGFVCELLSRNGVITLVAAISPYPAVREEVRARIPNFVEIYVECPLEVVAGRDVKGLYKKAKAGEIPHFTGVSDPYEAPLRPEVVIHSDAETPEESAEKVWAKLRALGL